MVPVVDLSRHGRAVSAEFQRRVAAVIERGTYLLGPETAAFEAELAASLAGPARGVAAAPWLHAVAVASGASALQVAMAALGVGPGDEVVVPAFTAVPTASAVAALGATPVFAEVERDTANVDPDAVRAVVTDRTRAVVVVHLYGRPARLPDHPFIHPTTGAPLPVVEDAAQAHGAVVHDGRSAAVTYSFYPTKNLGGIGDGGAVVTHDPALADAVRRRRAHGATQLYVHEDVSQNFRLSEIEAAWLRLGLDGLQAGNERRRTIAQRYREAAPGARWQAPHDRHVHHLCVLRVAERDAVRDELARRGVATSVQYPLALTQQPAYVHLVRTPCPEAEAWAAECVSLPCFPELTDDEVHHVASVLRDLADGGRLS